MRFIFLLVGILYVNLFAYSADEIVNDYQNKKYKKICTNRIDFYKDNDINEKFLTIIGDACAKIDYISPLGYIVRGLISTPEFRENGSYFATLVLQKKLIYQFMNDGIDLKNLRLPRSEHVLSIIFENLVKKSYKKEDGKIVITTPQKVYRVWIDNKEKRVVHVDEYKDGNKIKTHEYL